MTESCALEGCDKVLRSDNRSGYCKMHHERNPARVAIKNAQQNARRAIDPQKHRDEERAHRLRDPDSYRQRRRVSNYGMSRRDAILVDTVMACQATGIAIDSSTRAVDHCHAVGHVRGVLHSSINVAIGLFRDDPALLRAAADYLERTGSPYFDWTTR